MQTATEDPLIGRTLEGRYRILNRIARGGMSIVYEAIDERLDRLVAVKVMSAALSADPAFSDRFSREARAAARLTHVNVVAVYDQGEDVSGGGHHVFLVMELVEGRTLRDLIIERGHLTPAQAISIMEPLLSALSAAHLAGLVHRDVKPENILLSDDGVVKVADFGLARAVEADPESTRTGLMMGTVAYCSPEQISRGEAEQSSDVYSAGVVLFEMLTGTPPYTGESAMNVAYQHVHSRVPAPSSRVKAIPSEIDELVVKATDSDPAERPADAGEFLAEVAEVRAALKLPIVAIPPRIRPTRTSRAKARSLRPSDANYLSHVSTSERTQDVNGRTEVIGPTNGRQNTRVVDRLDDSTPTPTAAAGGSKRPRRPAAAPPPPVVVPPTRRRQRTEPQRRRRRGLITLLIIVLLGLTLGVAGWWFASGRYSQIPDVHGLNLGHAESSLTAVGYTIASVTPVFSETVPATEVIATDPAIGSRLERGKAVSIMVSKGKEMVSVPTVRGQSAAAAQAAFAHIGVATKAAPQYDTAATSADSVIAAGNVLGTSPAAGLSVPRSSVVTIMISKGAPPVTIPTVVTGTPFADVSQALTNLSLGIKQVNQFSDSIPQGGVISVEPATTQIKFQDVTVTVSKGPETVTIPEIARLSSGDDAKSKLEQLGLHVKVNKLAFGLSGLFVSIDPPSGTVVHVGDTVTITIV